MSLKIEQTQQAELMGKALARRWYTGARSPLYQVAYERCTIPVIEAAFAELGRLRKEFTDIPAEKELDALELFVYGYLMRAKLEEVEKELYELKERTGEFSKQRD